MSADERNYTHLAFDRMSCPVKGCTSLADGPQEGSIPGIKRHVKLVHGQAAYDKIEWPPLRTSKGPIAQQPGEVLVAAAKGRGLTGIEMMSHDELVAALTAAQKPDLSQQEDVGGNSNGSEADA